VAHQGTVLVGESVVEKPLRLLASAGRSCCAAQCGQSAHPGHAGW
jgi:hypothetical protein